MTKRRKDRVPGPRQGGGAPRGRDGVRGQGEGGVGRGEGGVGPEEGGAGAAPDRETGTGEGVVSRLKLVPTQQCINALNCSWRMAPKGRSALSGYAR